jgi:hypothetical protein
MAVNMGYIRFENTYAALSECYDALINGEQLSDTELEYAHKLYELCEEIKYQFEYELGDNDGHKD